MSTDQSEQPHERNEEPEKPREATTLQKVILLASFGFALGVVFWFGYLAFVGTSYTIESRQILWYYNFLSAIDFGAFLLFVIFVISSCRPIRIRYAVAACTVWLLLTSGWLCYLIAECLTRGAMRVILGTVALMFLCALLLVAVCISNRTLKSDSYR
jgi:hypothetical protein